MKTLLNFLAVSLLCVSVASADETLQTTAGPLTVKPISHATLLLKQGDTVIAVDPVGDAEPLLTFGKPDYILITHIHGDHYSQETVEALVKDGTKIICPANVGDKLGEVEGKQVMANGDMTLLGDIKLEALPMYNTTEERLKFHPKGQGNGYLLTFGKTRIYVSGDTEGLPELESLTDIHAAFLCMNVPYTMSVEKAAELVKAMKPSIVFPYHFRNGDGSKGDMTVFKKLVEQQKGITVKVLDWYPEK
jgi:L-ascorbate metabolism protein UlaG (beta-lactamase superfamily)